MRSWKSHSRSLVRMLLAAAIVLVGPILAPHLRAVGLDPPGQALAADHAEFLTDPGGLVVSATINGTSVAVPAGFKITLSAPPGGTAQMVAGVGQTPVGVDRWFLVESMVPGFAWVGDCGPFDSFTDPSGRTEIHFDIGLRFGTYAMVALAGERVTVTPGPTMVIRIGERPPLLRGDFNTDGQVSTQDIFDFVSAWCCGDGRADCDRDGAVAAGDIFDFLQAWFAP